MFVPLRGLSLAIVFCLINVVLKSSECSFFWDLFQCVVEFLEDGVGGDFKFDGVVVRPW